MLPLSGKGYLPAQSVFPNQDATAFFLSSLSHEPKRLARHLQTVRPRGTRLSRVNLLLYLTEVEHWYFRGQPTLTRDRQGNNTKPSHPSARPNLRVSGPRTRKTRKHCIRQVKPGGPVPEGKAALMFEVTLITESANHNSYRVSLRSSSKQAPSNPSPNGVCKKMLLGIVCVCRTGAGRGPIRACPTR